MKLIPAIDLRGGKCVRLLHGKKGSETVYGEPEEMAARWVSEGAQLLHVVDLDAAFGEGSQRDVIAALASGAEVPLQVGGGVRTREDFDELLELGVYRVVFGTAAVESPDVVTWALERAPDGVVLGVDVREGRIALRGWTEEASAEPADFGRRWAEHGVRTFVYTDTTRDGALTGPNVEATEAFADSVDASVIASGGIGSLEHVRELGASKRLAGAILGRALYENKFTLAEARAVLDA